MCYVPHLQTVQGVKRQQEALGQQRTPPSALRLQELLVVVGDCLRELHRVHLYATMPQIVASTHIYLLCSMATRSSAVTVFQSCSIRNATSNVVIRGSCGSLELVELIPEPEQEFV